MTNGMNLMIGVCAITGLDAMYFYLKNVLQIKKVLQEE